MVQYYESFFFITNITTKNSNGEIGNYNISQIRSKPFESFIADASISCMVTSSLICTGRVKVMSHVETMATVTASMEKLDGEWLRKAKLRNLI